MDAVDAVEDPCWLVVSAKKWNLHWLNYRTWHNTTLVVAQTRNLAGDLVDTRTRIRIHNMHLIPGPTIAKICILRWTFLR